MKNHFNSLDKIKFSKKEYHFYNLKKAEKNGLKGISNLPISYKILLENLIRNFDGTVVTKDDIENIVKLQAGKEISFKPSRVLMQDYTGVPAVADLASMRDYLKEKKIDPKKINPLVPVSLIIDHSIIVDDYASTKSLSTNVKNEFQRNTERYQLLKWAQSNFTNFQVFPPGSGICHQINLEFLAEVICKKNNILFFDSVVGTDSHTTMINALSVLGWGVGGIEAESVMLGQSISMLIPEVTGVKLYGKLNNGITATDLVLHITEKLRKIGVVGKFVEFFGPGLKYLSLSERSTISNMAPEYGATCGIFPIDNETLDYLELTGRNPEQIKIIELYSKIQGTWSTPKQVSYSSVLEIKLDEIESSIAGPKRPQDRIKIENVKEVFNDQLKNDEKKYLKKNLNKLTHGSVCVSAITSCTNTSNPAVLIAAGLIAKKAVELKASIPYWVKTSLAPGSQVVEEYLKNADLLKPLNKLGFNIVGYGCTTCIGNSGALKKNVEDKIITKDLNVCSVISGNRNFEGRIHPLIKSNFLASPPLVILYALAGTVNLNLTTDPIFSNHNKNFFLKDLWPSNQEINLIIKKVVKRSTFKKKYRNIFDGDSNWKKIKVSKSETFKWSPNSTYIKKPPFLESSSFSEVNINEARPLLILGDSVTTDHISPAGVIKENSSAGDYLSDRQVSKNNYNSYGARRGNHEVMIRGTFANIRIRNKMTNLEGGFSVHYPSKNQGEIFEIAKKYKKENVPLIVLAGKEYGTGSSRDWAAKGTKLLGVRIVIAESFERIHRSNLVGMGVLPLQLKNTELEKLALKGNETFNIGDIGRFSKKPKLASEITINYSEFEKKIIKVISRIDTISEIEYFKKDGILPYVLGELKND